MQIERQAGNICVWSACLSGLWKRQRLTKIFWKTIKTKLLQSGLLCSGFFGQFCIWCRRTTNPAFCVQAGTPAVWWAMGTVCRKKRDKRRRVWCFDHRRRDVHKNHLWIGFHWVESHHLRCSVPRVGRYLAACSGLLYDHDDPRLGGASMVGCSRSADQFYTIVFSLSKKSIAPQRA